MKNNDEMKNKVYEYHGLRYALGGHSSKTYPMSQGTLLDMFPKGYIQGLVKSYINEGIQHDDGFKNVIILSASSSAKDVLNNSGIGLTLYEGRLLSVDDNVLNFETRDDSKTSSTKNKMAIGSLMDIISLDDLTMDSMVLSQKNPLSLFHFKSTNRDFGSVTGYDPLTAYMDILRVDGKKVFDYGLILTKVEEMKRGMKFLGPKTYDPDLD
jgi:hypothetical protein